MLTFAEFRQQRRRFCLASRRLLDGMWLSVLHSRNTGRVQSQALNEESQLLNVNQSTRKPRLSSLPQSTHG